MIVYLRNGFMSWKNVSQTFWNVGKRHLVSHWDGWLLPLDLCEGLWSPHPAAFGLEKQKMQLKLSHSKNTHSWWCVSLLPLWIISVVFSLGNLINMFPKQTFTFSRKRRFHILESFFATSHFTAIRYNQWSIWVKNAKTMMGNSPVSGISFFNALSASRFLFLLLSRSTI